MTDLESQGKKKLVPFEPMSQAALRSKQRIEGKGNKRLFPGSEGANGETQGQL